MTPKQMKASQALLVSALSRTRCHQGRKWEVLSLAILFVCVSSSHPAVLRVPDTYPAIQQAINDAQPGDTVLVSKGTYRENINFLGKTVRVQSEHGPLGTILDGGQTNSVITFRSGEGRGSVLNGFTLRNGLGYNNGYNGGGGILIANSSPTILSNIIAGNRACFYGFGVYVSGGAPLIQGNVISNNTTFSGCSGGGGALAIYGNG